MTTLLVDRRDVELSLDGQRVLIREPEARPRTVPLAMLQRLVIQGRARLDTNLLAALGEHGVDVLLLGARHGRRYVMIQALETLAPIERELPHATQTSALLGLEGAAAAAYSCRCYRLGMGYLVGYARLPLGLR